MTVSQRDGKISTVDGPFMETKEILGGLVVIDARDLNEAVRVISGHPLARMRPVHSATSGNSLSKRDPFSKPRLRDHHVIQPIRSMRTYAAFT